MATVAKEPRPHEGHRKRVRERFVKNGADTFSEAELLEFLLFYAIPRVDTRPIAERLLETFGSLDSVLLASPEELHANVRLPAGADCFFALLRHLQERSQMLVCRAHFFDERFLASYLPIQFIGFRKEHVILFFLDKDGFLLHRRTIVGGLHSVNLTLRSLTEPAERYGACSLIIAHNHPNGKPVPSAADLETTRVLHKELKEHNLTLLEHYIVADTVCRPILNEAISP